MFEIKKGIALPKRAEARVAKYPFAKMEVGDCFDVPRDKGLNKHGRDLTQNSLGGAARSFAALHNSTAKFATRQIDEKTIRCWRIK